LDDVADAATHGLDRFRRHDHPVDPNVTGVGDEQPADQSQNRGFPATAGTDQRDSFAGTDKKPGGVQD
jgi:hypothetical protein